MSLIIVLCDVCLFKVKCCFFPLKFTFSYGCMLIILYLILPHYCLFFIFFFYLLSFSFPCTISVRTMDYVCLMSKQTYVLFYSVLVYSQEMSIDVHVSLSFLCLLKYWKVLKNISCKRVHMLIISSPNSCSTRIMALTFFCVNE